MEIQKLGHACLLVTTDAGNRVLIDPGTFSAGFEDLTDLSGILVTHQHADHLDVERARPLLSANPAAVLMADPDSAATLSGFGFTVGAAEHGEVYDVGGVRVEAVGRMHAVIHADIPQVPNVGYLIEDRLLHPGDALNVPERPIELLALPAGAPWVKSGEVIDYLRAVAPVRAFPIHERTLAHPMMEYRRYTDLGPTGTDFLVIDDGSTRTF